MGKRITTWHGIDASNEESLFEYGFLIRWNNKRKQYEVYYKYVEIFIHDWWDADNWREMLTNGDYDLKGIADMCGMNADTYLEETSDANLLSDILSYYGIMEVADYYNHQYTESEIRRKLNKALN